MTEKINIKSYEEIEKMKKGGHIAALVLEKLQKSVKPGITTQELNDLAEKEILSHNGKMSFKGFGGYPAAICVSVNEEVVHGLPSPRRLKEGDIVGIDLGVYYLGYHSDTAISVGVGKISPENQKLMDVTKKSLDRAIENIRPGRKITEIQAIIQKTIEKEGYGVIRDLTGHGIGKNLQEFPSIPNYVSKDADFILKEGMTIAIEPMVSIGDWHISVKPDGWTIVTRDHSNAAHFEHTIAVAKTGALVLTKI